MNFMQSFKIGLAGYMGAGKTTCSRILANYGAEVIDADYEAKLLMEKNYNIKNNIIKEFGNETCNNGHISFVKLGNIVFSSIENIRKLNSIVHPPFLNYIYGLIQKKQKQEQIIVLDAGLIPLWNIEDWFDLRIWVYAPFITRLERILNKAENRFSRDEVSKRIIMQQDLFTPPSKKKWRYVLNDGEIKTLKAVINDIFEIKSLQNKT